MKTGGNASKQSSATGSTYVLLSATEQICKQITLVNDTGTAIEWRQDVAGVALPLADGASFTIFGIKDTQQIGYRRVDVSNTQVTLKYRWEA